VARHGRWSALVAGAAALSAHATARADCFDRKHDGFETGIDCGAYCAPCRHGQACRFPRDCASGRCADGICEEQIWDRDDPVPRGYHVETATRDVAAIARTIGWVSFGTSYAAAYVTALTLPGELSWLYVPVAGAWVEVADRDQGGRGLLVLDAALQTVGLGLLLGGYAAAGRQIVRDDAPSAGLPALRIAPLWSGAPGLAVGGRM